MIEKAVIEACRNGNLQEFRKIIDKTSPMVYSVAFRMLGDEELARDIVQETMISIWQKIRSIKSPESFRTWVYRVAVNKCYDCLRKRKHDGEVRMDDNAWALLANRLSGEETTELDNSEIALIINTLTDKLSPRQKTVFVLAELEEMTNEEIAAVTGISRTLVKANLYHSRKKMAELLKNLI